MLFRSALRQSSWWGRHPIVGFCVLPPFAIVVATIASLASGWGLFRLFLTTEEWRALIDAGAGPELLSGTFHGGYSVVIGLMAIVFCWLARRSVSGLTWALVACGLCALHSLFFQLWVAPTYVAVGYYLRPNWIGASIPLLVAAATVFVQRRMTNRFKYAFVAPWMTAALMLCCVKGFAQTNSLPQQRSASVLVPPELQKPPSTIEEMLPKHLRVGSERDARTLATWRAEPPRDGLVHVSMHFYGQIGSEMDDPLFDPVYRRLEQLDRQGRLMQPDEPSDNRFVRAMDSVFRPEVVKIGGVAVSCSVITAVKRKNPLCLLNPMVIGIAW